MCACVRLLTQLVVPEELRGSYARQKYRLNFGVRSWYEGSPVLQQFSFPTAFVPLQTDDVISLLSWYQRYRSKKADDEGLQSFLGELTCNPKFIDLEKRVQLAIDVCSYKPPITKLGNLTKKTRSFRQIRLPKPKRYC